MVALTGRWNDWFAGAATGCDRLVDPAASGIERARRSRLLGVLLAGPFIIAAAMAQAAWPLWGVAGVLAMLCAVFGASWLVALFVATHGRLHATGTLALLGGALIVGTVVALSGGLSTPVAMLLVAVPLEAWWVSRSQRVTVIAAIASVVSVAGLTYFSSHGEAVTISAWQWISPVLYGLTLGLRFLSHKEDAPQVGAGQVAIPDISLDAVVIRLGRTGEAETVSPQSAQIFGLEPELLLGSGLFERIQVADRVAFLCAAAKTRDEGTAQRCDIRIRMPVGADGSAGSYQPFEVETVSVAAGAVVAIIRDGQEKARLRVELAKIREEIDAAEITKSRFLATVSHELRTPLNAIIGFSDMLLYREISGDLEPKQSEKVGLIRDAGNHLLSVVNAILDVSKIEAGSYHITTEPFDLTPAVELCCAMLEPQASARGVTLATRLASDCGQVMGDRRAVQQILINLLSNAIKFTPGGGKITVNAAREGRFMRILVSDNGIGIKEDDLARIGQPFVQVQNDYTRQFQGTGLGLSLVKGLVKLHGGSMSIESASGLGTTVTICLPVAAGDEVSKSASMPVAVSDAEYETGERYDVALRKIA